MLSKKFHNIPFLPKFLNLKWVISWTWSFLILRIYKHRTFFIKLTVSLFHHYLLSIIFFLIRFQQRDVTVTRPIVRSTARDFNFREGRQGLIRYWGRFSERVPGDETDMVYTQAQTRVEAVPRIKGHAERFGIGNQQAVEASEAEGSGQPSNVSAEFSSTSQCRFSRA